MLSDKYATLKKNTSRQNIIIINKIAQTLKLPQRAIYVATSILHRNTNFATVKVSENVIISMCVLLASKLCDNCRDLKEIIALLRMVRLDYGNTEHNFECDVKDVINYELQFCLDTGFVFTFFDPYASLKAKCTEMKLDKSVASTAWVLLNDSCFLPLAECFLSKDIVMACINIAIVATTEYKEDKYGIFTAQNQFIMEEIIALYDEFAEN